MEMKDKEHEKYGIRILSGIEVYYFKKMRVVIIVNLFVEGILRKELNL